MMETNQPILDIIIVGAGPAGLSAAIYTSRAGLSTLIFGDETKSNLWKSHVIANYFAFPGSPTGPELTKQGLAQIKAFGVTHLRTEVVDIKPLEQNLFEIKDSTQQVFRSKAVIIATGQSYVLSGIKNEQELTGKGISYCVTCDGFFFKNQSLAVIGSGDYAAEEALELTNYSPNVTILSHGKEFNFSLEHQQALAAKQVKLMRTVRIAEFIGNEKFTALKMIDGKEMNFDGVFMAVGIAGASAFAKKMGMETVGNYLKIDHNGQTNIPGIFAAGDCTGSPAQVAASVGSGCIAALSAIRLVRGLQIYIQYN